MAGLASPLFLILLGIAAGLEATPKSSAASKAPTHAKAMRKAAAVLTAELRKVDPSAAAGIESKSGAAMLQTTAKGMEKAMSDLDDTSGKETAVSKVVRLLKDMQARLEYEAKNDQELYDQLSCWCETNEKEKTKAIATATQQIKDLTAAIEEYTAADLKLTTDIEQLDKDITRDTKSLAEATQVRAKDLGEFNENEKDMIESIGSLKGAVTSMSKAHGGSSALQRDTLVQVAGVLRRKMATDPDLVRQAVPAHRREQLAELLRPDGMVSLLQQPVAAKSFENSGGDEIFGMLKQMKEHFEENLVSSKKQEAESAAGFDKVKAAKSQELKAATDKLFNLKQQLGQTVKSNAQAKDDLENTQESLETDTEFLADLKAKCETMDADWDARSKMRGEEIAAVSDTIDFLMEDDARDLMSKTTLLLQVRLDAQRRSVVHSKAIEFLADAGRKLHSEKLSYLATRMRFDPFGQLRENIDGLVVTLDHEKTDEIHHKDDCVSDFNTNEQETDAKEAHKGDVEAEINYLDVEEGALQDEEKRLTQEIADAQIAIKAASENRQKENKEFQEMITDQRATQAILDKAKNRLGDFYASKAAAMLQTHAKGKAKAGASKAPEVLGGPAKMPEGFAPYEKSEGGGAMRLIEQIIDDSKMAENDAIHAEQNAQAAYEKFVLDTNASIKAKQKQIVSDKEQEAKDEVQEAGDKGDKRITNSDINVLHSEEQALHTGCDFTLDNFDERQHKRDDETEALKQAKAIFSGAGFGR